MKFQCKFCRKRMEPKIVLEKRMSTTDQETYYCSLCGKQLFVLGGFLDKPFWLKRGWPWTFLIVDWIDPYEKLKNCFKERSPLKLLFAGITICFFLIYFLHN